MATHFICQSTEPLPHVYPTGLSQKSHGAVSQYEVLNSSNKPHTHFPPPSWDFSQSSEEDSLPLLQPAPQPQWRNTSLHPDPELCVTPQKPLYSTNSSSVRNVSVGHGKTTFDPDPLLTLTPEKSFVESGKIYNRDDYVIADKGKKVRFDIQEGADTPINESKDQDAEECSSLDNFDLNQASKFSPDKVYKPELYGNDGVEKQIGADKKSQQISGNSRTVKYTVGKINEQPVYVGLHDENSACDKIEENQPSKTQASGRTIQGTESVPQVSVKIIREKSVRDKAQISDNIALSQIPENRGPKRKVKVLRENQYMPKNTEYTYPFNQNALDYDGGEEHMFARPEYNSTLRMKLEADRLKASEIDVELALKKKLTVSDTNRTEINEKAASHVNKQGSTFSGLVSLDLPAEEICHQAAEQKTLRAKPTVPSKTKNKEQREPDLMEFFTPGRQKESVTYALTGISAPTEQLSMAPHWRAFDLYKHSRVWEGRGNKK